MHQIKLLKLLHQFIYLDIRWRTSSLDTLNYLQCRILLRLNSSLDSIGLKQFYPLLSKFILSGKWVTKNVSCFQEKLSVPGSIPGGYQNFFLNFLIFLMYFKLNLILTFKFKPIYHKPASYFFRYTIQAYNGVRIDLPKFTLPPRNQR